MSLEGMGNFIGSTVGKKLVEGYKKKVEGFDISVKGVENFDLIKERSCVVVSNHLKPKGSFDQGSGISPDAFVISKLIEDRTGQVINVARKSDNGWRSENPIVRGFQKMTQPFGAGLSKGAGFISVLKDPGSVNRDLLKTVSGVVEREESILIFPEGDWQEDFDKDREISTGAAHIAKKHGLTVIPVFICGADGWEEGKEVSVAVGSPFSVEGMGKDEISDAIKNAIATLQAESME